MDLTPSQEKAIEDRKQLFAKIHPNVRFMLYQPRNFHLPRLVAEYEIRNVLGAIMKASSAWTIGKRGKVS